MSMLVVESAMVMCWMVVALKVVIARVEEGGRVRMVAEGGMGERCWWRVVVIRPE